LNRQAFNDNSANGDIHFTDPIKQEQRDHEMVDLPCRDKRQFFFGFEWQIAWARKNGNIQG
jgi:hypothetical protein